MPLELSQEVINTAMRKFWHCLSWTGKSDRTWNSSFKCSSAHRQRIETQSHRERWVLPAANQGCFLFAHTLRLVCTSSKKNVPLFDFQTTGESSRICSPFSPKIRQCCFYRHARQLKGWQLDTSPRRNLSNDCFCKLIMSSAFGFLPSCKSNFF